MGIWIQVIADVIDMGYGLRLAWAGGVQVKCRSDRRLILTPPPLV